MNPLTEVGSATARRLSRLGALARFGFGAVAAAAGLTAAGRRVAVRVTLNQIRFTAVQAVGLLMLLSGIPAPRDTARAADPPGVAKL